jgi:outer membrane protein OmpA-like peptidoglycan-associated protein
MPLLLLFFLPVLALGQLNEIPDSSLKAGYVFPPRTIWFDFDKTTLKPETLPYLDSLAEFLVKHKTLVIEVSNHTDTRWSDKYSSCLSCKRARAIADYLISKGLPPDRLLPKGYNATKPLIPHSEIEKLQTKEEIEKAHQTNRRTEFKILRTDYSGQ